MSEQQLLGLCLATLIFCSNRQLQLAIKGEVVMSEELQDALNAIYDARVAKLWTYTIAGDEFSWILPTLGLWFSSLITR